MNSGIKRDLLTVRKWIEANFQTLCIDGIHGKPVLIVSFDDENQTTITVELTFEHYSQVGFHIRELNNQSQLVDAFEVASRDGFNTIYIHSLNLKGA